jgi:hypothetical protein
MSVTTLCRKLRNTPRPLFDPNVMHREHELPYCDSWYDEGEHGHARRVLADIVVDCCLVCYCYVRGYPNVDLRRGHEAVS